MHAPLPVRAGRASGPAEAAGGDPGFKLAAELKRACLIRRRRRTGRLPPLRGNKSCTLLAALSSHILSDFMSLVKRRPLNIHVRELSPAKRFPNFTLQK